MDRAPVSPMSRIAYHLSKVSEGYVDSSEGTGIGYLYNMGGANITEQQRWGVLR